MLNEILQINLYNYGTDLMQINVALACTTLKSKQDSHKFEQVLDQLNFKQNPLTS